MGRSGFTCLRLSLICLNLLFWIIGCGILGVGIWIHISYGGYSSFLLPTHYFLSLDSLCIIAGLVTFIVCFLGCCGAWFHSKSLLQGYFVLVILIFILQFLAGTLGFIYRKEVGEVLKKELSMGIKNYYKTDNTNGLAEVWDHIQTKFSCCGVESYQDWYKIAAWPDEAKVPTSCCKKDPCEDVNDWHQKGCYQKLHMWVLDRLYIVGILCLTVACIQLFGLLSALVLFCTMTDWKYVA